MVGVAHGAKPFQTVLIGPRLQGDVTLAATTDEARVPKAVQETRGTFSLAFAVEMIFFSDDEAQIWDPQPEPPPPLPTVPQQGKPALVVPALPVHLNSPKLTK
jgi:hypothetical protein